MIFLPRLVWTVLRFRSYFKRCKGMTFSRFVTEYRLNTACELLKHSQKQVSEICFAVGFNDVPHFNRIFKKLKGVTPQEYRKNGDFRLGNILGLCDISGEWYCKRKCDNLDVLIENLGLWWQDLFANRRNRECFMVKLSILPCFFWWISLLGDESNGIR